MSQAPGGTAAEQPISARRKKRKYDRRDVIARLTIMAHTFKRIQTFYTVLFWSELVALAAWAAFSVWSLILNSYDLGLTSILISLHFIAPAAVFYSMSDLEDKLEVQTNPHKVNARYEQNSVYVVVTILFVDATGLVRSLQDGANNGYNAVLWCYVALGITFTILSFLHLVWLLMAISSLDRYKEKRIAEFEKIDSVDTTELPAASTRQRK